MAPVERLVICMEKANDLSSRVVRHSMRMRRRLGRGYDPSKIIDRLLRRPLSVQNQLGLLNLMIGELRLRGKKQETLRAIDEYIRLAPKHPEPWIVLASYYREDVQDQEKAILASDVAVAIAKLDGNFARQALGERMRSLLWADRLAEANACLEEIASYRPARASIDIDFEDDFLLLSNANRLDQDVVSRYRALLR